MSAHIRTLLAIAAASALQAGCQQPDVNCTSAHGTFAARYDFKSGDKDQPCGQLAGDILGMQTYFAEGGVNNTPKFDEPTVAIRGQYLYDFIYDNVYGPGTVFDTRLIDMEVGDPDSLGEFASGLPDAEGFCPVPKMSRVNLDLPEFVEIPPTQDDPATPDVDETDPGIPGRPATKLTYEWSDVKFLVTADAQGTQFSADLKFTQDSCSATYHVVGVYPAIGCLDEMGAPDNSICESDVNGINPDFPTECDKNFGYCVLKGELPAYD
jgi:hypothetical protein